jgi:hypothetical protein
MFYPMISRLYIQKSDQDLGIVHQLLDNPSQVTEMRHSFRSLDFIEVFELALIVGKWHKKTKNRALTLDT